MELKKTLNFSDHFRLSMTVWILASRIRYFIPIPLSKYQQHLSRDEYLHKVKHTHYHRMTDKDQNWMVHAQEVTTKPLYKHLLKAEVNIFVIWFDLKGKSIYENEISVKTIGFSWDFRKTIEIIEKRYEISTQGSHP